MYQPFNENKPAGEDTPPVYGDTDLANVRALRDGIVSGFVPGWAFAFTQNASPQQDIYTWSKGIYRLRAVVGYASGSANALTWLWSEDSGANYANINTGGTAASITSGGNGSVLAMDKDSSAAMVLGLTAFHNAATLFANLTAHANLIGPAAHGLGNISTQDKGAVNFTGGTASGVSVLLAPRITPKAPVGFATGVLDFAAHPTQEEIAPGANITGFTNAVRGEMKRIIVTGAGAIGINAGAGNTLQWGVGHPNWGTAYTIVNIVCVSPTLYFATTIPF